MVFPSISMGKIMDEKKIALLEIIFAEVKGVQDAAAALF
jgi:hypothetical protein